MRKELAAFFGKQILCSMFPLWIFFCLWFGRFELFGIPRYDFLLGACLIMQALMLRLGLETKRELMTICAFHFFGLLLELYKVSHGSWAYPEDAFTKFGNVPLYSGFMYASVASYMTQAWRRFNLHFKPWPKWPWMVAVGISIYANFFLSRSIGDSRWLIVLGVFLVFARTQVHFTNIAQVKRMPLILAFFLIGLFVWFAENLCTYLGAWQYPHQRNGWEAVDLGKLSSWCLLVIVSFLLVAGLKRVGGSKASLARA